MRRMVGGLLLGAFLLPVSAGAQSQALTRATLAKEADVQARIMFLATKVALSVMVESPETCCGETPEASVRQHEARVRFAASALRDPFSLAFRVSLAVLTDTSIAGGSSDADIEAVLRAQWNAYAAALGR